MFCTKVCSRNTVGPRTSTTSIRITARARFSSESTRMPLFNPLAADSVARAQVPAISPSCTGTLTGRSNRWLRPPLICSTP
ncbi:hypothetical protein D9M71_696270 [compost metagenome]